MLAIVDVRAVVSTNVGIGECAISSRSGIGRRDTYGGVVCEHDVRDIDPHDPANIKSLRAVE